MLLINPLCENGSKGKKDNWKGTDARRHWTQENCKNEERDRKEKEEEINYQNSIKTQIMMNKRHNDKIKKN